MQRNIHVFEKYELCYTIFACEAFYLDAECRCHITVIDNGSVMYMLLQPDDEHSLSDHFQIKCSFFSKWKHMYMCHSCLWRISHWWKTKHRLCRFTALLVRGSLRSSCYYSQQMCSMSDSTFVSDTTVPIIWRHHHWRFSRLVTWANIRNQKAGWTCKCGANE